MFNENMDITEKVWVKIDFNRAVKQVKDKLNATTNVIDLTIKIVVSKIILSCLF